MTLQGTLIELFEMDLTSRGGPVVRWCRSTNEFGTPVVWAGITYEVLPVEATGFDFSGSGKLPRPMLRVANANGVVGSLAADYGDFLGCKVTRRRTFAKYLDAANFINGNPQADPYAEFPPDVFFVNRKTVENKTQIEWELVSALDLQGVVVPKRQIVANYCPFMFPPTAKHPECPYTGGLTTCDHTLDGGNGCKVHFPGTGASYPFGGFPAADISLR